jgi:sugar phosphate isomerase/epimerase
VRASYSLRLYLGGQDPIAWLQRIKHRLVHIRAKDITLQQSAAERGKVMGTLKPTNPFIPNQE